MESSPLPTFRAVDYLDRPVTESDLIHESPLLMVLLRGLF